MCRTSNGADINAEPGTNPQTKDGRGNICPVTIILPTIAMEATEMPIKVAAKNKNDESVVFEWNYTLIDNFMTLLDEKIYEAKDMLLERFNYICSQNPSSAKFMWENHTMLGYRPEEGIRSALKHGTIVVG